MEKNTSYTTFIVILVLLGTGLLFLVFSMGSRISP